MSWFLAPPRLHIYYSNCHSGGYKHVHCLFSRIKFSSPISPEKALNCDPWSLQPVLLKTLHFAFHLWSGRSQDLILASCSIFLLIIPLGWMNIPVPNIWGASEAAVSAPVRTGQALIPERTCSYEFSTARGDMSTISSNLGSTVRTHEDEAIWQHMTTILYVTVSQQSNTDGICPLLSIYTTQGVTDLGLDSSDSEAENPHLMGKKTNHQAIGGWQKRVYLRPTA